MPPWPADIMLIPPSALSQQLVSVMLPWPHRPAAMLLLAEYFCIWSGSSTSQVPSAEMKDIACNSPGCRRKVAVLLRAPPRSRCRCRATPTGVGGIGHDLRDGLTLAAVVDDLLHVAGTRAKVLPTRHAIPAFSTRLRIGLLLGAPIWQVLQCPRRNMTGHRPRTAVWPADRRSNPRRWLSMSECPVSPG